jgi:hypothetical protein
MSDISEERPMSFDNKSSDQPISRILQHQMIAPKTSTQAADTAQLMIQSTVHNVEIVADIVSCSNFTAAIVLDATHHRENTVL